MDSISNRTRSSVGKLPILVIEGSKLPWNEIVKEANQIHNKETVTRIKHQKACHERWQISCPDIYVIHQSDNQIYMASNMQHAHYQILPSQLKKFKASVRTADLVVGKVNAVRLIEVPPSMQQHQDDFITVINNLDSHVILNLDKARIAEELKEGRVDPSRGNKYIDLGFTGDQNSHRDPDDLGLTKPGKHSQTDAPWSAHLFATFTSIIGNIFPGQPIYNDSKRNELFSNDIAKDNIIESMRMSETDVSGVLVDIHSDDNCSLYSHVVTISWPQQRADGTVVRHAVTAYGRDCVRRHMEAREKHKDAIGMLERVYQVLPEIVKRRDTSIFPEGNQLKKKHSLTLLDTGILYSLYASAIFRVFNACPSMKENLDYACAFFANVASDSLNEHPEQFWHICSSVVANPRDFSFGSPKKPASKLSPVLFACALASELSAQTRSNVPACRKKMEKQIAVLRTLFKELRQLKVKWNTANTLHCYGRSSQYLVENMPGYCHLKAMSVLGVGACVGLCPPSFLEVAEMGTTTNTWNFFKQAFGYKEQTAYQESTTMMRAASTKIGIPLVQIWELCCYAARIESPRHCRVSTVSLRNLTKAKGAGAGTVIHRDMQLFHLRQGGTLFGLDRQGVIRLAPMLIDDHLFDMAKGMELSKFWSRRFQSKRTFHYRTYESVSTSKQPPTQETLYELKAVVGHRMGLERTVRYKGCSVNVMVKWSSNEVTEQPMDDVLPHCAEFLVSYAEDNNVLSLPGWGRVKKLRDSLQPQCQEIEKLELECKQSKKRKHS